MDEDQWMYDSIMSEEVNMDYQNEEEYGVNEPHVDCSNVFNTSQVIMFMIVSDLIKWMCCKKLKLSGLLCRCLTTEMMYCGGLDPLLMKTDLLQSLWGLAHRLIVEEGVHLC